MRKTGLVLLAGLLAVTGLAVAEEGGFAEPVVDMESRVLPEYPPAALAAGFEGVVSVAAVVHSDGTLGAIEVIDDTKPHLGFGEAAIAAMQQWRFVPAQVNGDSVDAVGAFTFRFHSVGRIAPGALVSGEMVLMRPIADGLLGKDNRGFGDEVYSPARHVKKFFQKYGKPPQKLHVLYDRTKLIPNPRRSAGHVTEGL